MKKKKDINKSVIIQYTLFPYNANENSILITSLYVVYFLTSYASVRSLSTNTEDKKLSYLPEYNILPRSKPLSYA